MAQREVETRVLRAIPSNGGVVPYLPVTPQWRKYRAGIKGVIGTNTPLRTTGAYIIGITSSLAVWAMSPHAREHHAPVSNYFANSGGNNGCKIHRHRGSALNIMTTARANADRDLNYAEGDTDDERATIITMIFIAIPFTSVITITNAITRTAVTSSTGLPGPKTSRPRAANEEARPRSRRAAGSRVVVTQARLRLITATAQMNMNIADIINTSVRNKVKHRKMPRGGPWTPRRSRRGKEGSEEEHSADLAVEMMPCTASDRSSAAS